MRRIRIVLLFTLPLAALAQPNDDGFVPGHIFITEREYEACFGDPGAPHFIREIDPRSGRSWRLTKQTDNLCAPNGLAFTPDGKYLRVLNFASHTVMDFDSAGNGRIVYDRFDSINSPSGQNAVAFDESGYCYIFNSGNARLLKFPPEGGGPSIFADRNDGLGSRAGMAFASNGDLFVAPRRDYVLRIAPSGEATVFDTFERGDIATTLAFDAAGNLFVGIVGDTDKIFRYDAGKTENRRLLVSGIQSGSAWFALAVSPDQRELYGVYLFTLYAINARDGTTRVLYESPREPLTWVGHGIVVFFPPGRGDVNCDGSLDLADVEPFIAALLDPDEYENKYPDCDIKRADITLDGSIDLLDVEPFIVLLLK